MLAVAASCQHERSHRSLHCSVGRHTVAVAVAFVNPFINMLHVCVLSCVYMCVGAASTDPPAHFDPNAVCDCVTVGGEALHVWRLRLVEFFKLLYLVS